MFQREEIGTDLAGLGTLLEARDEGKEDLRVSAKDVNFHLDDTDPHITLKSGRKTINVPAGDRSLEAVASYAQIPKAALSRAMERVDGSTMNGFLTQMVRANMVKDEARITVRGTDKDTRTMVQIVDWDTKRPVEPLHVVRSAISIVGAKAPVVRLVDSPDAFGFDVYAPSGTPKAYGGNGKMLDFDKKEVDDITAGGLRFGLDMKHGLAPTVGTYLYRLWCTNGMTLEKPGLKIDARGSTVEEVIRDLEAAAQLAFGAVEADISAFYDLKSQKVDNVERAIRAIAREREIPDRSTMTLMDLASSEDMPDNPTLFDVVNLVTNLANNMNRDGGRILLEGAGGSVVTDHAARCGHCMQKVH